MNESKHIQLLVVVEVDKADRIYCQEENCKHTVFKQIHVVRENGQLKLYGSSCFAKKYHNLPDEFKNPLFRSSSGGTVLSTEERQMLIDNTERLISIFQQKFEAQERIRKAYEARRKQENERLLAEKNKVTAQYEEKKNNELQRSKMTVRQTIATNEFRLTDRFSEHYLKEIRAFELECETLNPNFSEQQFMRSMWVKLNEQVFETIIKYEKGINRTQIIDLIIRYFRIGTSSDPWGFSLQLQSSLLIPKIVTFQVLSDFGLIRVVHQF